jgi:Putative DNA-binding domain
MRRAALQRLAEIQQRLGRLITAPGGVEAALAEQGDGQRRELAALVQGDRGLPPAERLEIYANAYFARLHDCLRDDFAALARALGGDAFHDLVKTYLMLHPPSQPSLRHAGAQVAQHLSEPPFAQIFARRCAYAADLARLEWAIGEAFYAADAPALAREDLAAVAPDAWPALRFEIAPSVRLLECAWPVQIVRERHECEDGDAPWSEAPQLDPAPTFLQVWRCDEQVRFRAIPQIELDALRAASTGESFAAICERLADALGEVDAPPRAASLLASWCSDGLVACVRGA